MEGTVFIKAVQLLGFADGLDVTARNLRRVSEMYTRRKTETMLR